jgi:hypothetical protein
MYGSGAPANAGFSCVDGLGLLLAFSSQTSLSPWTALIGVDYLLDIPNTPLGGAASKRPAFCGL